MMISKPVYSKRSIATRKPITITSPTSLKQVVDQSNLPFRRLVQGRFESYQQSVFAGQITFDYKVNSIKTRDLGFVQAQVARASDGAVADWTVPAGQREVAVIQSRPRSRLANA